MNTFHAGKLHCHLQGFHSSFVITLFLTNSRPLLDGTLDALLSTNKNKNMPNVFFNLVGIRGHKTQSNAFFLYLKIVAEAHF